MNNRIILYFSSLLIGIFLSENVFSQYESRGDKFNLVDAESFYEAGNYHDALPLYELLMSEKPEILGYQLKIGICHIKLNKSPEKAIEFIKGVYDKNPKVQNVEYFLGKAYSLNYKFSLAIESYKKALANYKTSPHFKKKIPLLIQQCENGINLKKDSLSVQIINLGAPVNTPNNEYGPIINSDETMLIYTYRGARSIGGRLDKYNKSKVNGSFNEDIYISHYNQNEWSAPLSISDSINSELNEAGVSLSADGLKLYLYKDTERFSGDIYESTKEEDDWSEPIRLAINSKYWEGHVTVSSDGKRMIFSSNRPGGIGGKDLYSAELQEDGSWSNINNLGPTINTQYNEDSPFLHADGSILNFSSEGHTSIGGYDIFESKIVDSIYSTPENIGYPINTTSNDIFFYVSGNGNVYYSSSRRGGYGQNDIYLINVNGINVEGVAVLYKDPLSPITRLKVNITNVGRTFSLTDTTDEAGRYHFSTLKSDDYILYVDEIDEESIDDSIYVFEGELTKMGRPYTKATINSTDIKEDGKYRVEVVKKEGVKGDPLDSVFLDEMLAKYGDKVVPGLVYKIQVAALKNPENFDKKQIKELGELDQLVLDDGIARLTVGKFETLNAASQLLSLVKSKNQNDAFIIAFVNGKRTYLEALINLGVFK